MALESSGGLRTTTPKLRSSSLIVLSAGAALVALIGYLYMKKRQQQLERRQQQQRQTLENPTDQPQESSKPSAMSLVDDKEDTQAELEKISQDLVRIVLGCATKKLNDSTSTKSGADELDEAHELSLHSISLLESETATSSDTSLIDSPKGGASSTYRHDSSHGDDETCQNVPEQKQQQQQQAAPAAPSTASNLIKSSSTTSTASSSSSAAISTSNQAVPPSTKTKAAKTKQPQTKPATQPASKNSPESKAVAATAKSSPKPAAAAEAGATVGHEDIVVYEFNFPRKYCGKLIGKNGVHVDYIRSKTRTQIAVRDDPDKHEQQIVCVSGRLEEVDQALDIISSRFPLKQYPNVSFKPISKPIVYRRLSSSSGETNSSSSSNSNNSKRALPFESASVKKVLVAHNMFVDIKPAANELLSVHVSAVVNASHVFVQLPGNSTYESLQKLDECMLDVYGGAAAGSNNNNTKEVPVMREPIEYGSICVAPTSYGWHRAMVTEYLTADEARQQLGAEYSEECGLATVKFLDYGGYLTIPANQLRQLRSDFMLLPFQAVECYLDGIYVYQGTEEEGKKFLTEIIKGAQLKISLCGYAEDGIPLIKLFLTNDIYQNVNLNSELVNYSYAFHIEPSPQTSGVDTTDRRAIEQPQQQQQQQQHEPALEV